MSRSVSARTVSFLNSSRYVNGIPSGPGFRISDFESNRIIGQRQADGAKKIMSSSLAPVSGPVKSVHTYMNM